jgi:hypothetical protein
MISKTDSDKEGNLQMQETLIKRERKERVREIVLRTRGSSHGPITRLVSPSDLGQAIKPFVFLDYFDIDPKRMSAIGFHPHSGIETVTVVLQGLLSYQECVTPFSGDPVLREGRIERKVNATLTSSRTQPPKLPDLTCISPYGNIAIWRFTSRPTLLAWPSARLQIPQDAQSSLVSRRETRTYRS